MCTLIIINPFVGEANAESKSANYNCTFPEMIKDWRAKFHTSSKGETDLVFPFGFAQVLQILGRVIIGSCYEIVTCNMCCSLGSSDYVLIGN